MRTHPSLLASPSLLVALLSIAGCDTADAPDASAPDARLERDAAPFDAGPIDAHRVVLDAFCAQQEPDPDRSVQCSLCEPRCLLTREQPREGDTFDEGVELDASLGGLRLTRESDGSYVAEGRLERTHDGSIACDPLTEFTYWETLGYEVDLPAGTSIDVELRGATSASAIPGTSPVIVPLSTGVGELAVSDALLAADRPMYPPFLSITVVLHASADALRTPLFHHYDLRHSCLPGL
ncbi:MAG: hypothetical protein J0L92_34670 [Deltaproteobacteria bacterium]|nr:hypothetical protein [Deltaproteobacteria bacterium]